MILQRSLGSILLVFVLLLVACQPIQPVATEAAPSAPTVPLTAVEDGEAFAYDGPASIAGGMTRIEPVNPGAHEHGLWTVWLAEGYGFEDMLGVMMSEEPMDEFPGWITFYGGVSAAPGTSAAYMVDLAGEAYTIFSIAGFETGMPDFARGTIFDALGVGETDWWADGVGTTIGGQNLSMAPRDMAKLGLLYLHGGVWEGEQLVPADWVQLSLTPQNTEAYNPPSGQDELIEWQGLHWWTWKGDWFYGYRSFQAAGYAGQQVLVFPELDLILVTTANLNGVDVETEIAQRTALHEFILNVIFPALTDIELEGAGR